MLETFVITILFDNVPFDKSKHQKKNKPLNIIQTRSQPVGTYNRPGIDFFFRPATGRKVLMNGTPVSLNSTSVRLSFQ